MENWMQRSIINKIKKGEGGLRLVQQPLLSLLLYQTLMHGPGTSRRRSAPCGRTSRSSTAAVMTRTKMATSHPQTTVCRACWANVWSCLRTSTTAMRCGWRGRSSPSPSNGRACCRIRDGRMVGMGGERFQGVLLEQKWSLRRQKWGDCTVHR